MGFPIDFTFFVVLQVLEKHYASHDLRIRAPALFCGVDDAAPDQKSEGREGGREEGGRKVTGDPCSSSSRRPQPAI